MKTDQTQRQNKLTNFSVGNPIDLPRIVDKHGGYQVFVGMLGTFLDNFNETLAEISVILLSESEYSKLGPKVEEIKNTAEYLGASRIFYQSHFMIQCCGQNRFARALDYYQSLVEAIVEWRIFANKLYEQNMNENLQDKDVQEPSLESVAVFKDFFLVREESQVDGQPGKIYCCKAVGQSLQERKIQKKAMLEKPSNLERFEDEAAVFAAKGVLKTPRDAKAAGSMPNGNGADVISNPVNQDSSCCN